MRIVGARPILFLVAAGLVAVALYSPPGRPSLARRALVRFGIVAPVVAAPAVAGKPLELSQPSFIPVGSEPPQPLRRRGQAMLIDIFATWCPPCREELAALALTAPALKREHVQIIGIDRAESAQQVEMIMHAYGLRYPVYIDTGGTASWASLQRVIPTTILLDKHGVVRFVYSGPLDYAAVLRLARLANA